jgi:hypothetical protein
MLIKTLSFFASELIDPLWRVFEILEDKDHPQHLNLLIDIDNIDNEDYQNYVIKYSLDSFVNRQKEKEVAKRAYYLAFRLQKEIAKERFLKLLEFDKRPEPYNKENLSSLDLDKHNLITTDHFNIEYSRFQYNNSVYELCPINGGSNSSYWLFQAILKCIINSGYIFKIRLDPFKEFQSEDYIPMIYKMYVHGKPLNWGKLLYLRNEEFGQWFDDHNKCFTDYVWSPTSDEISFTCEEYPSFSYNGLNTSRYFHAIFNKKTGSIKHCDGAIRVYDDFEISIRKTHHIKQPEIRKIGKRIKIFQFDSTDNKNKEIEQNDFCHLAVNFYVWNQDVQNYFNM